jgi:hypothetical protein
MQFMMLPSRSRNPCCVRLFGGRGLRKPSAFAIPCLSAVVTSKLIFSSPSEVCCTHGHMSGYLSRSKDAVTTDTGKLLHLPYLGQDAQYPVYLIWIREALLASHATAACTLMLTSPCSPDQFNRQKSYFSTHRRNNPSAPS